MMGDGNMEPKISPGGHSHGWKERLSGRKQTKKDAQSPYRYIFPVESRIRINTPNLQRTVTFAIDVHVRDMCTLVAS